MVWLIKKTTPKPQVIVRQPLKEVVMLEVSSFQHFVLQNQKEIYSQVDEGFDVSKW